MHTIDMSKDFSAYPAGRDRSDGPNSAERFRDDILAPALRDNAEVTVVFSDGIRGLPASFLEEAFGGLVRLGFQGLSNRLVITAGEPLLERYRDKAWQYVLEQQQRDAA